MASQSTRHDRIEGSRSVGEAPAAAAGGNLGPIVARVGASYFERSGNPVLLQGCSVAQLEYLTRSRLATAASRGVTLIRAWPDYGEAGALDEPAIARLRIAAEDLGVYFLFVLFSPGCLSDIFDGTSNFHRGRTVYNAFCKRSADVIDRSETIDVLTERCRAILRIFGDSPALMGWEIVNETDPLYEVPPVAMSTFIHALAANVRREDARVSARRLITASSFQPVAPAWLLDLEDLDFVAFHPYAESIHQPTNVIDGARHVGAAIRHVLRTDPRGSRPILDTESGIIAQLFDPAVPRPPLAFRAELAHNLRWAHFASGGAGTGLHVSVNDEGMRAARRVDADQLRWEPVAAEFNDISAISRVWTHSRTGGAALDAVDHITADDPRVLVFASRTSNRWLVWLLRDTRPTDLRAEIDVALAEPTSLTTLDHHLFTLDAWRAALRRTALDPFNRFSREAISLLIRRRQLNRACEMVDEGLSHLASVTRSLGLADDGASVAPTRVNVTIEAFPETCARVFWFNDADGTPIDASERRGPRLEVVSPPFDRHIALTIEIVADDMAGARIADRAQVHAGEL